MGREVMGCVLAAMVIASGCRGGAGEPERQSSDPVEAELEGSSPDDSYPACAPADTSDSDPSYERADVANMDPASLPDAMALADDLSPDYDPLASALALGPEVAADTVERPEILDDIARRRGRA